MRKRISVIALAMGFMALTRCTLNPITAPVSIRLVARQSTRAVMAPRARSGPELTDMKCYGLLVEGEAGQISAAQIGLRSPACLGLIGGFHGPYTYQDLVSGQNINLPRLSSRQRSDPALPRFGKLRGIPGLR